METYSVLRYLPRRSILCCVFIGAVFFTCAFYTLIVESRNLIPVFNYIEESGVQNEIDSNPPNAMVVHQLQSDYLQLPNPISIPNDNTFLKKVLINNVSSNGRPRNVESVQVPTRYVYLNSSSTTIPPSTSTSALTAKHLAMTSPPDSCRLSMKEPKLILLWTSFFDYWDYFPAERFRRCSRCRNCKVTTDRSKLLQSHAVIFHARDMSITDMPSIRLPHQRWIFYCLESPPYSDFPGLQHTQYMFNWTMTYRADSDIFSPYGTFSKVHPTQKLDMQALEWAFSNKSKSVVWMSSHCPTDGGRDLYVEELRKYIDVDVYGTCGTSICPPGETAKCLEEFSLKYKFFLAFENTICKDYITEKFYRTFKYDIIPVVFGGANYHKFAPPGSFVDALSFKSPKHLAFFLAGAGKSFKIYSKFFQWRKEYSVQLSNSKECDLCAMLNNKDLKPFSYENLREWWVTGSKCKTWKLKR